MNICFPVSPLRTVWLLRVRINYAHCVTSVFIRPPAQERTRAETSLRAFRRKPCLQTISAPFHISRHYCIITLLSEGSSSGGMHYFLFSFHVLCFFFCTPWLPLFLLLHFTRISLLLTEQLGSSCDTCDLCSGSV